VPATAGANRQPSTRRRIEIRHLGVVPYLEAQALQAGMVERRKRGEIGDCLLLVEHPHVITLGGRTRHAPSHVIATPETLASRGVELVESTRGGDVTYHGPGQVVAYPLIDLKPDRCDVHRYVRDLEEAIIRTAARFGVEAGRQPGVTGVWVGDEKLAAIGVRISRWVTSHGLALNVTTDLGYFDLIVPCGIQGKGVTSLERLTGRRLAIDEVRQALTSCLLEVFEAEAAS
jgi:lipoyl(octanoyl) transferase